MIHCTLLHENIFAYVEKELPPDLLQQLDKHVSDCRKCTGIVSEFRNVIGLMEEEKSIAPRPHAETRILQGIESRLEKSQKSIFPVFTRILQPAMISAGVLIALSIGALIGSDMANTHSASNRNAEMLKAVRTDLNVPVFMTDDLFYFTE